METFSEYLRAAAQVLMKRASEATPGPWERPLDIRDKAIIIAELPADEEPRSWMDGVIPGEMKDQKGPLGRYAGQRERVGVVQAGTMGHMGFARKRSGRDLEYIALMDPRIGTVLARWLEYQASLRESGRYAEGAPGDDQAADIAAEILGRAYKP